MKFRWSHVLKAVFLVIVCTYILVENSKLARFAENSKEVKEFSPSNEHKYEGLHPTILIWYPPFGQPNPYSATEAGCGEGIHCTVTYDRSLLHNASAVVFHFADIQKDSMPEWRSSDQLYVWWSGEIIYLTPRRDHKNIFNLTFTYRRDSDIYAPYGSLQKTLERIRKDHDVDINKLMERKRKSGKIAAWVVSNCHVKRRLEIAEELENYGVKMDKFGRCFGKRLEKTRSDFFNLLGEYKFYLAFENSYHCKDYITEKFWYNSFVSGAVPIVWGAQKEDVLRVAPTKSFIHVDDFNSTKQLADFLVNLAKDEEEYRSYLEWRKWAEYPEMIEDRLKTAANSTKHMHSFCSLCKLLLDQKVKQKNGTPLTKYEIPSLYDWAKKSEHDKCFKLSQWW